MLNLLIIMFFGRTLCSEPPKTIHDIIQGNWNITKSELTNDGLEDPDSIVNYTLKLSNPKNNQTYFSDIYCLPSKNSFHDDIDESSSLQSHSLKLSLCYSSIDSDNCTNNEPFNFSFDDNFTIEGELIKSIDKVRRSVGVIYYPLNVSYSFTILSSYRAKLTLFDRDSGKVTVFRFMKEYETGFLTGFGKYASYLMRKMIFRMI